MSEQIYEYRTKKRWLFVFLLLMFSFAAYLALHWAADPGHVVKYKGIVMGKTTGLVFLYLIVFFSAALVLFAAVGIFASFVRREAVVGGSGLRIPKHPLSCEVVEVKYGDFIAQEIERLRKHETLVIRHRDGVIRIPESALPDRLAFETLCKTTEAKAKQAKWQKIASP